MISDWLSHSRRSPNPFKEFGVFDITEQKSKDISVKNDLKNIFDKHSVNFNLIKMAAAKIGWNKAYSYFGSSLQPTDLTMKKGRFGEIILAGILEEFFDYVIPVHKLKYTFTRNQSLPSTDLLAIKMSGDDLDEVCFVESKLRTRKDRDAVVKGYDQLMDDQTRELPEIGTFVMQRLEERKDPLLSKFLNYFLETRATAPNLDTFRIGTVFDHEEWEEQNLARLQQQITGPQRRITVDIVKIKKLEHFVEEFYKFIGVKLDV